MPNIDEEIVKQDQALYDVMFEMLQDFERVHEKHIDIGEFAVRSLEKIVLFSEQFFRNQTRIAEMRKEIEAKFVN